MEKWKSDGSDRLITLKIYLRKGSMIQLNNNLKYDSNNKFIHV